MFFAGPVHLTRYWCCRVPRYSLLAHIAGVCRPCCVLLRGFYGVFVFMHRGMCEALFGVPVFRTGCEICRVMFALR